MAYARSQAIAMFNAMPYSFRFMAMSDVYGPEIGAARGGTVRAGAPLRFSAGERSLPDLTVPKLVDGANSGGPTGTVFDSIKARQPVYPDSAIPRSFEMTLPNGERVWVAGNATEHMAEFAQMKAVNYAPEAVRLASQQQLSSLQGTVNTATQTGNC